MSVDNPSVVDAIGIDRESGEVVLTVTDHHEWGNIEHLSALQEKLNRYFGFVESGELTTEYPDAISRAVRIDIVFRHQPNTEGVNFLAKAGKIAEGAGWSLSWRLHAA